MRKSRHDAEDKDVKAPSTFLRLVGVVTAIILSETRLSVAEDAPCTDATQAYNIAFNDLGSRLKGYADCFSKSEGEDDCSSEFGRLKDAQKDYEAAVLRLKSEC